MEEIARTYWKEKRETAMVGTGGIGHIRRVVPNEAIISVFTETFGVSQNICGNKLFFFSPEKLAFKFFSFFREKTKI